MSPVTYDKGVRERRRKRPHAEETTMKTRSDRKPVDNDTKLRRLLLDYNYDVRGDTIISKGIRGFCPDSVWGRCRSIMDACERLIPIIHDDEFTGRYNRITNPKD
jgi:hypothetical protein